MKPLDIHPAARAEAHDHAAYYATRAPALARDFLNELHAAFVRIAEAPTRWPEAQHDTRRLHLRRFPYTVFYLDLPDRLWIVAIAPQKRRPYYWSGRVP